MRALVERAAWLRHSWWFQWAHKPLCEPYREDVLRLGRLRLCRGCSALWGGALAGAGLALAPLPAGAPRVALWFGLFALCAALSHPSLHARWPRPLRDALRFSSGLLLPLAVALVLDGDATAGLAAGAALGLVYLGYARLRRDARLAKCAGCAELGQGVCSGYAAQGDAIRAWEEAAAARELARRVSG